MYESPINMMLGQIQTEFDDYLVGRVSQTVGLEVDKQELIKALQYDRDQYNKGYSDGQADAKECKELLKELYQTVKARESYECAGCIYENADARTRYLNCTNYRCYRWCKADRLEELLGVDK